MKFRDNRDEDRYRQQTWQDNKSVIRAFSIVTFVHTLYLISVNYGSNVIWTPFTYFLTYGIYVPVPIAIIVLAYVNPYRRKEVTRLWYLLLTIASVMLAIGIALRGVLCFYRIENPQSCTAMNRPVSSADYSIIYILLGPFLFLTVMRNSIRYELIGIILSIALLLFLVIISSPLTILTFVGFIFIIGAYVMGIVISRNREKAERKRYISDMRNVRLGEDLQMEIIKKTEAQKRAKQEEDRRTQFTSILFHEMRVPLNAVVLSMNDLDSDELLKSELHEDAKENLERIDTGLKTILNILNDSLDIRKMEEGKMEIIFEPFEYHKLLRDLSRSMEPGWKSKKITFQTNLDHLVDDLQFQLLGDPTRLRQVVANYLSNATKFTSDGGRITLSTKVEHEDGASITIYTAVTDNGIGISEKNKKTLFKPFVQIDPQKNQKYKGTGLGLYICALIIRSMGGTYGVDSVEGRGSTFWFRNTFVVTNVLKGSKNVEIQDINSDNTNGGFKKLKILVTDDDIATRRVLCKNLQRSGHDAQEAVDGLDCIEKVISAYENGEPFNIIFIDNQMPRMNGLEAIADLRRKGFTLPIISVTGSSDLGEMRELQDSGATMVIVKPVEFNKIKSLLQNLSMADPSYSVPTMSSSVPIVVQPQIPPPSGRSVL